MSINVGHCMTMCPHDEVIMREREKLLHPLEIILGTEKHRIPKADPKRIIKQYNRSAAGIDLTKPDQLRPPEILYETIKYILTIVINDNRFSLACVYDFITNRFRSISQDIVIQSLSPNECIRLYEPIVKFHTLFAYRLCEEPLANYDPVLNKKQLMEYLQRLLVCYDSIYESECNEIKIINSMKQLSVRSSTETNKNDNLHSKICENRPLFESIYILSNLGDKNTYQRYLTIPVRYKTPLLKLTFEIALNHLHGNFVKICKLATELPSICLCVFALQLPNIRRQALNVMSIAYNSKQLLYPVDNLTNILMHADNNNTTEECLHYSIEVLNNNIRFDKDKFNKNSAVKAPKKIPFLNVRLKSEDLTLLE